MRTTPLSYADDEDLKYLAELNNENPDLASDRLPEGGPAPKVNDVVPTAPAAEVEPDKEPDSDLDDYISQQAAQANVEPEVEAPARAPTVPDSSKYAPPKIMAQTQGTQAQLVSTKPQWFESLAPPKITGAEAAIPAIAGGFISALTGRKKDAAKNFFGAVPNVLGALLEAPQQNYQNRLKAADTQAGMHAKLASGSGGLGMLNYDLAERKFQHLLDKEQTKAAAEKALKDPNSPESKELRDAYVNGGIYKPEVAAKMSGWQMMQARVGAQQQAGAERNLTNQKTLGNVRYQQWVEKFQMANNEHDRRKALDEINKIAGEERDQEKLNEQAEIPGLKFVGKRAPNIAAVEKAREISAAKETLVSGAARLAELQQKISDPVSQSTSGWVTLFPNGEDQKDILAEMKFIQQELAAAQRVIWHQGVPQQYELASNAKTNPDADSVWTFFKGPYAWNAMARAGTRTGDIRLKNYGYVPDDGVGPTVPQFSPQQPKHSTGEMIKRGGEVLKEGVDKAKDVAGQVASAVAPAVSGAKSAAAPAGKTLKIQVLDPTTKMWGAAREVTEEQYRQAMKKLAEKGLGPSYIRKAQ